MWGKQADSDGLPPCPRFTPTRVGKTHAASTSPRNQAVHPHACGENICPLARSRASTGSPPRVWGKRLLSFRLPCPARFTPTRVGKTRRACRWNWGSTVHPHACGENAELADYYVVVIRFTPTRVGKTPSQILADRRPAVHPHACGENYEAFCCFRDIGGSPPRVWGKLAMTRRSFYNLWFTPTRVGKTLPVRKTLVGDTVHPHACGENAGHVLVHSSIVGSPPRVWGKLSRPWRTHPDHPVHPHACGENIDLDHCLNDGVRFTPTRVGKTWGKRSDYVAKRFTPTRVGKTRGSLPSG